MSKKIVILGAGYSGVLIAKKLTKKLKNHTDADVTIIDKNPFHTMLTELHEVAAWRVDESSIRIDLKKIFAHRNVNIITDTIVSADYKKQILTGKNSKYSYDYLIICTGCKPTSFGVDGIQEYGFTLWSYDDAVKLREHIIKMFHNASIETDAEKKKSYLTFYVIGSGFTGLEMVGELAELSPILCKKYNIEPSLVKIKNVDILDRIAPILPEKLSNKVMKRLQKMNVEVMLKTNVVSFKKDGIVFSKDGKQIEAQTHTAIWTAGTEGSDIVNSSSELGLVPRGRVQTDKYLRSKNFENVYVGGDNIYYIPDGEKTPVPQMVENCEACAAVISNNILVKLSRSGTMKEYKPKFHGIMVCIGGRYGVAHVGTHNKKVCLPSFLAMLVKHLINIMYFFQVLGWNKVSSYLKHEFFTIRNNRSFVGGHFSNNTPSFLLVPLRVFLGIYWFYEGYKKIIEGWLNTSKLNGFFSGADAFWNSLKNQDTVADTTSAATEIVNSADTAVNASGVIETVLNPILLDLNIFNHINILLANTGELALKVSMSPSAYFINTFVLFSDDTQIIFQNIVVLSEILIGLALITGLFTTLASSYSLILQFMFLSSTGLYMSTWWMVFAAIAVLIGGGRTFGLDYYVMPHLKRSWRKLDIIKKWYLYHD